MPTFPKLDFVKSLIAGNNVTVSETTPGVYTIAAAVGFTGLPYYLSNTASDISGYNNLYPYPSSDAEFQYTTATPTGGVEVLIDEWVTNGSFSVKHIPAGTWTFHSYMRRSGGSGATELYKVYRVFKRSEAGIETQLFTVTSSEVTTSATLELYETEYTIPTDIPLGLTDRLVVKEYALRTSGNNASLISAIAGTEHASHVDTTLAFAQLGIDDIQGLPEALYLDDKTGSEVAFDAPGVYGLSSPLSGSLTSTLTGAKRGVECRIYHNDATWSEPAGWVKLGSGAYAPGETNIIIAQFVGGTRIEYVITQES